jgi:hypothetical protein
MYNTRRWLEYFRSNQSDPVDIPWAQAAPPQGAMARVLLPSLQQFQLGENASGLHFLELAREHARRTLDPDFPEAIALFIAEEQRHSSLLARYLRLTGTPLLSRHWVHAIFRRIRHWAGLESKVTVLVTAEIMALPYYRAVLAATRCPTLSAICRRILREEARHLLFQGNTLRRLQRDRPPSWVAATHTAQEMFLAATCVTAWLGHRRVFAAAGQEFFDVWRTARAVLAHVQRTAAGSRDASRRQEALIPSER